MSRSCIEGLRESHATLARLRSEIDNTREAGWSDLSMALSLGQNCCNCAEEDVRDCQQVKTYLDDAQAMFGR